MMIFTRFAAGANESGHATSNLSQTSIESPRVNMPGVNF